MTPAINSIRHGDWNGYLALASHAMPPRPAVIVVGRCRKERHANLNGSARRAPTYETRASRNAYGRILSFLGTGPV